MGDEAYREQARNYQPGADASHSLTGSENTENTRIYQNSQHVEFKKSVFLDGQTLNYGVSESKIDDLQQRLEVLENRDPGMVIRNPKPPQAYQ